MDRLNGAALVHPNGSPFVRMTEVEQRQYGDTIELLQERIAELESTLASEDVGWQRLSGEGDDEFSREYLRRVCRLSRLAFLRNPLINRAVTLQAMYVWGQGVSIEARHPAIDAVVQAFLDDPKNQAELTSHQARILKEQDLQIEGNLFFCFFVDAQTGRVRVRTIPVDQVAEVVTNPDDARDVWFYKRVWTSRGADGRTSEQRTVLYPDWRHTPKDRAAPAGEVAWETPVYHVRGNGQTASMRFGVPETYQALDWARAYKSFLEDWATIVRAYSRFAWNLTAKGGAKGVQAAKTKLGTTIGNATGETNPPPGTGSVFIGADGYKLDPIRTAGATVAAEDGRRLLLMVAAATGMPETFFGDAAVGTLATAKSLDRPTELKFADRRTLWSDVLTGILDYVVDWAVRAPKGPLTGTVAVDDEGTVTVGLEDDPETTEPINRGIDVTYPSILERDVAAAVAAVVQAATLGGSGTLAGTLPMKYVTRLLLQALGEDDLDELLDEFFPEDQQPDPSAPPADPTAPAAPASTQPEEAFTEAVRELRDAVRQIVDPR